MFWRNDFLPLFVFSVAVAAVDVIPVAATDTFLCSIFGLFVAQCHKKMF